MFEEVARTNIEDTKNIIKSELKTKLKGASPLHYMKLMKLSKVLL